MALLTGALQGLERALQSELKFELNERQRREDRHWKQLAHDRGLSQDAALAEHRANTTRISEENLVLQQQIADAKQAIAAAAEERAAKTFQIQEPYMEDLYAGRARQALAGAQRIESELPYLGTYYEGRNRLQQSQIGLNEQTQAHREEINPLAVAQAQENLDFARERNPRVIREMDYLDASRRRRDALNEQYLQGQITRQEYDLETAKTMDPLNEAYRRQQISGLRASEERAAAKHPYELYNLEQLGTLYDARIAAAQGGAGIEQITTYDYRDIEANAFNTGKQIVESKQSVFGPDRTPKPRELLSYMRTVGSNRLGHYMRITGGDANKAHRMLAMEWAQVLATEEVQKWIKENASGIGSGKSDMQAIQSKLGMAFLQMVAPNNWDKFMGEGSAEPAQAITPEEEQEFQREQNRDWLLGPIFSPGGAGP